MGKALWRSLNRQYSIHWVEAPGAENTKSRLLGLSQRALGSAASVERSGALCAEPRTGTCGTRLPSSGDHVNESGWFAQGPGDPTALEARFPTGQGEAAVQPFGGSTRPIP